jgi:hypothetical protein
MVEQKARSSLAYVVEHLMLFLFQYPLRLPPASRARLPLKPLMKAKPSLNSRRDYTNWGSVPVRFLCITFLLLFSLTATVVISGV